MFSAAATRCARTLSRSFDPSCVTSCSASSVAVLQGCPACAAPRIHWRAQLMIYLDDSSEIISSLLHSGVHLVEHHSGCFVLLPPPLKKTSGKSQNPAVASSHASRSTPQFFIGDPHHEEGSESKAPMMTPSLTLLVVQLLQLRMMQSTNRPCMTSRILRM